MRESTESASLERTLVGSSFTMSTEGCETTEANEGLMTLLSDDGDTEEMETGEGEDSAGGNKVFHKKTFSTLGWYH